MASLLLSAQEPERVEKHSFETDNLADKPWVTAEGVKNGSWRGFKVHESQLNEFRIWIAEPKTPAEDVYKRQIYAFENEPLIDILKKMELYYDVKIVIKDTSLFNDTYTGKFRQRDSLDDVFRVLHQIRKFKVEKDMENNIITLSK